MLALRLALYFGKVWGNFEICWRVVLGLTKKKKESIDVMMILQIVIQNLLLLNRGVKI